jgi:hypothetical protein
VSILHLSIALSRKYNTFTIGNVGTLLDVCDAEISIARPRVESLEIRVIRVKGPNRRLVVIECMQTSMCGQRPQLDGRIGTSSEHVSTVFAEYDASDAVVVTDELADTLIACSRIP